MQTMEMIAIKKRKVAQYERELALSAFSRGVGFTSSFIHQRSSQIRRENPFLGKDEQTGLFHRIWGTVASAASGGTLSDHIRFVTGMSVNREAPWLN